MLQIDTSEPGELRLTGRLDASQAEEAHKIFNALTRTCVVHFDDLDYISSAGLGVLLEAQQRLEERGAELILTGMTPPVKNVFYVAGFDAVFDIR